MADIRNYLNLSNAAMNVENIFTSPQNFADNYKNVYESERKAYLRHFLINNIPFAFKNNPLLYEQIVQYFADNMEISPAQIKLIGSGKTGFSISVSNFGRAFQYKNSDLDFSIVNEGLFEDFGNEYELWSRQFSNNQIFPLPNLEMKFWPINLVTGAKQITRGFIDTKYVPNREQFPRTGKINSTLYYIKKYLFEINELEIKEASVSIYKNWNCFMKRLQINTEDVLSKAV